MVKNTARTAGNIYSMLLHHSYLQPSTYIPAVALLGKYFKIYDGTAPVDRSGTILFPTLMKSIFPLPLLQPSRKSYKELCADRAADIARRAQEHNAFIYLSWSGGVDSTCALVCLLEYCEHKRIIVLLTDNSIAEYPKFYQRHIRGKLRCQHANVFPRVLASPNLFVSGEHNDQLFGSDIIADAISFFGIDAVLGRLQRELLTSLYEIKLNGDRNTALFFSGLFGRLGETAPVVLKTNFDLPWWINFTLKWQTVYMRTLAFSHNPLTIRQIDTFYQPFFKTNEFQLWSMHNLDQRIKKHWKTYKWPAKDIIYEFTKDADYRDHKIKYRSLTHLFADVPSHNFIDENFSFQEKMDWYRPQNDFTQAAFDLGMRVVGADAPSPQDANARPS